MPQIPFKGKRRADLFMEPEEYRLLMKAARSDREATRIFLAMCPGGCRTIEVTWLVCRNVDGAKGGLWVKTAKRKDSLERFVGLADDELREFEKQAKGHADDDPLFVWRGAALTKRRIRYLFHKYKAKGGVRPELGPHSLRHLSGTILTEAGYEAADVANYLGHSNLAQVMVYSTLRRGRNREMAAAASKILAAPKRRRKV